MDSDFSITMNQNDPANSRLGTSRGITWQKSS